MRIPERIPKSDRLRQPLLFAGVMFCSLVLGLWVAHPLALRASITAGVVVVMLSLGIARPKELLYVLIVWLAILGLVRRLVDELNPAGSLDPLLLVLPVAIGVLVIAAGKRGAFRDLSPLAKGVLVLTALLTLGAVNPRQGGLATGAAGLFITVVPLLAFWIGRALCDDRTLSSALHLIGALAIGAAIYGLVQTFHAFPSWDQAWINQVQANYAALVVNGVVRPFATFSSAVEYAYFLSNGLAAWIGFGLLRIVRLPLAIPAVGLLAVATLYASDRTVVVGFVLGLGVALAARAGVRPAVAAVVGIVFLVGMFAVVSRMGVSSPTASGPAALLTHQVQGLANPLNPADSTTQIHLSSFLAGLRSAFTHPLGSGTGSISIAATKFGGTSAGTELDPSNAAVAIGLPGLIAYLVVLFLGLSSAYRIASQRRDALAGVALCVLVITVFQWLNGAQYAVAFLPWLILGWADRRSQRLDETFIPENGAELVLTG